MVQFQKPSHVLLLVFFLSLLPFTLTELSATSRREGEALVKWKNSLVQSSSLNSWSLTNLNNLCNWTGITCNSASSVSEIYLSEYQLNGTLSEFGFNSFSNLSYFNIYFNNFSGPIPPAIENLTQLRYLDLSFNYLNGSVPLQISHLQRLRVLDLSHNLELQAPNWSKFSPMPVLSILSLFRNHFVSRFPEFISDCHNLTYLDLGYNMFTGDLLRESIFTNLSNLETLYLAGNFFEGPFPRNIFNLSKLKALDLSDNKYLFKGSIPPGLGLLTNLAYLNLRSNNLTGYVPSDIGNLKALDYLDLTFNQLTGPLPQTLSNLSNLKTLALNDNRFSGNIPSDFWKNSVSLFSIDLSNNDFSGNIPKDFNLHPTLEHINLSGNNFTGELPATICNATSLAILVLSENGLRGALPHCLGNLADTLLSINLGNNQFQGPIPLTFSASCQLTYLDLNNNQFEGDLPQSLANCKHLNILDIGNNRIDGTFPSWLFILGELEVLVLRSNRLYGTVSGRNTTQSFPKLRIVDLSNNQFTGYLPVQYFKNMKPTDDHYSFHNYTQEGYYNYRASVSLNVKGREYEVKKILHIYTAIDLSCNKFYGEVPEVIGKLRWLALLNLSHNSLTGPIPSLLGNMKELQSLDLSSNQFTCVIPHELTSLTFLGALNLSDNHLTGEIPQKGQFSTFGNDSYLGNLGLCGLPLTKKCIHAGSPPQKVENGDEDDASDEFNWEVILMGYGCGLICGLSTGYIVFTIEKPWWFLRYIEGLQQKLLRR